MAQSKIILSAIGSDRPGLTQALADAVHSAGGNWLESHLSHLGGKYVGAVLVEIDGDKLGALQQAIHRVDAGGLHVSLVPASDVADARATAMRIEVVGQDRPGIVREVTTVLAKLGVNIEDIATQTENGAWSGERLFRANLRVSLPAGMEAEQVQQALEAISGEIMADLTVS